MTKSPGNSFLIWVENRLLADEVFCKGPFIPLDLLKADIHGVPLLDLHDSTGDFPVFNQKVACLGKHSGDWLNNSKNVLNTAEMDT